MRKTKVLIAFMAMGLVSSAVFASVVVKHDEASMTRAAHAVVVGQVLDTRSEWNTNHEFLWTYTRVKVHDVAKGDPDIGQTITVREVGGRVGHFNQEMIGAAKFVPGEQVVLFLEGAKDGTRGVFQTVGLSEGKFKVSTDTLSGRRIAVPDSHDLDFAGARRAMWDNGPVDLEDFLFEIRRNANAR